MKAIFRIYFFDHLGIRLIAMNDKAKTMIGGLSGVDIEDFTIRGGRKNYSIGFV